ncbi:unnamed protein product [Prorocentrum cordatum]|uniref:Cyclic nucleotide-binding domain-containing protein n=1 Tax=Prorocentrum cordatum TaxID=2364126 RepID=A0ABN9TVN0_9DINO|nr:unnamed protein product [Polarella glacialis]
MLVYIGIVFPYRLAFLHFRLRATADECSSYEEPLPWYIWEEAVFWFFWVDLFLNFFLTFRRESDDAEEFSWKEIAKRYLTRLFIINLVACLPADAFAPLAYFLSTDGGDGCATSGESNQAVRLARLQRATRLARLARLTRLVKILSFMQKDNNILRFRGLRMCNWIFFLFWVVHLMACGWYLCASLHNDHSQTWVARRMIDADGEYSLVLAEPEVQYTHSFYFVLTVFTTVGFGDMSAMTTGEIGYVSFTMIIGLVVNSIVIGEVINLVSEVDLDTRWRKQQAELLEAYGQHACLSAESVEQLTNFVHKLGTKGRTYNDAAVRKLMTTEAIPRKLLGAIPGQLFNGLLIENKLMAACTRSCPGGVMPPRFAILLSTMLKSQRFSSGDMVYQEGDNSFSLYLVLTGTFSFVGEAHEDGGMDACPFPDDRTVTFAASRGRKRVALEGAKRSSGKDTAVLNPPESERQYSGTLRNWRVFSALGQSAGAWTPEGTGGPHWMVINLSAERAVCGVVVQGCPRHTGWVTEFRVRLAKTRNGPWEEVAAACPGGKGETEVTFGTRFAKYVRIEPTAWHGQVAMRAGVTVRVPQLYPYQVFGNRHFFGYEMLLKPKPSQARVWTVRRCSARCEASGELLQLHKNHLLSDGELGGESILAEFPQFVKVLRQESLKRETHRRRIIEDESTPKSSKVRKTWPHLGPRRCILDNYCGRLGLIFLQKKTLSPMLLVLPARVPSQRVTGLLCE